MKIKSVWNFSAVLILLATVLACSKFEKVTQQEYRKDNLSLTHPSNWKITEDTVSSISGMETRYVNIEGPDDAIVILSRFPADVPTTLEEYVRELHGASGGGAKEVTGGYEIVKIGEAKTSPIAGQIGGVTKSGLRREFDVKALGVPVPHYADHYLIENGGEKWFVIAQASKEDWNAVKEGFQTIYDDLSVGTAAAAAGSK